MRVIAIVGPTATGKSALGIELAEKIGGEIISCDSMQVYKGMDIGTAKATKEEMKKVPHHMIDIIEPDINFSCADYSLLATEAVNDITERGKTPIFVGGTGLYLDSVIEIGSFCDTSRDENYRAELEKYAKENGNGALHDLLFSVDEKSAAEIHENNVKRVIRALEIYKCTGVPKSVWDEKSKLAPPPYDATVIYLTYSDRELLYKKIDARVDKMINDGLVSEVQSLYEKGYLRGNDTASGAIGYKEIVSYIEGNCSLDEATEQIKSSTRKYAKRQTTWFSRKKNYNKIYVDTENVRECVDKILGGING
ncbi:MAG: tRNA (adenosine(37)-N6)-dimethylallyltransferase MiaA [Eubacteriales bacterium]